MNNPNHTPEGMELEVITYPDGSQMATFVPKKAAKPQPKSEKESK